MFSNVFFFLKWTTYVFACALKAVNTSCFGEKIQKITHEMKAETVEGKLSKYHIMWEKMTVWTSIRILVGRGTITCRGPGIKEHHDHCYSPIHLPDSPPATGGAPVSTPIVPVSMHVHTCTHISRAPMGSLEESTVFQFQRIKLRGG